MASSFLWTLAAVIFSYQSTYAQNSETLLYKEIVTQEAKSEVSTEEIQKALLNPIVFDGLGYKPIRPSCDPRRLEENLLKTTTAKKYQNLVRVYLSSCSDDLTENSDHSLVGLLKFSLAKYDIFNNPNISFIKIPLKDGALVPALLAVKPDNMARPLVIVRCGVFCDANGNGATRNYLMNIFDQTPFNVVMLANQSGLNYVAANSSVMLGGWSEGYESYLVGEWFKNNWEKRHLISSMHLIGISLGGNAAVIGAIYNERNAIQEPKLFNSVAGICPVINLKPTLETLYSKPAVGRVFAAYTNNHFRKSRPLVPHLQYLLTDENLPDDRKRMPDFIGDLVTNSMSFKNIQMTAEEWFKANNFWSYSEVIKTPMLLWASMDDMIVDNKINTEAMENFATKTSNSNIGVINMKYGNHCGFNTSYGSQFAGTIIRSWVLKHSPEFDDQANIKNAYKLSEFKEGLTLNNTEMHIQQKIKFENRSNLVQVSFKVFDKFAGICRFKDAYNGSGSCQRDITYRVPVSSFETLGARVPQSEAEAQSLTREFNSKVEIVTLSGKALTGTSEKDFAFKWRTF